MNKPTHTPPTDCREASRPLEIQGKGLWGGVKALAETITPAPLTELEAGLTDDERRPLSVQGHHQFREGISNDSRQFDEVDELVEEIRQAEFEGKGARP